MATVTINGTELANDDAKTVRRALAKARREEKKADDVRNATYATARTKAECNGFKVLSRKASGESFPTAWRIYRPGDKWSNHLFTIGVEEDGYYAAWKTRLTMPSPVVLHHYGSEFVGAICDGGGYVWLIFLQEVLNDGTRGQIRCYAVGSCDGTVALAACPGIDPSDFRSVQQES